MKECDVFMGSKHNLTPSCIFSGVQDPLNPQDLRSCRLISASRNRCRNGGNVTKLCRILSGD